MSQLSEMLLSPGRAYLFSNLQQRFRGFMKALDLFFNWFRTARRRRFRETSSSLGKPRSLYRIFQGTLALVGRAPYPGLYIVIKKPL